MEANVAPRARGTIADIPARSGRPDRVLPEVQGVAAVVALVLLTAWVILYLLPTQTGTLFAWPITPPMTAMFMGAAYGAGAYYFTRVVLARRWHHVAHYFPGIAAFTLMLGIATIRHWEAFTGQPFMLECLLEPDEFIGPPAAVYTWLVLYAVTPFLVPFLWLRNRRTDPGTPDPHDAVVPLPVRWGGALAGAALVLLGLALFFFPEALLAYWPWTLSPLTAQVVGAFLTAPGVSLLFCSRDPRWSAWRILVQHQVLAVAMILLAVFLLLGSPGNPQPDNPLTWIYVGVMTLFLGSLLTLLIVMDRRRPQLAR